MAHFLEHLVFKGGEIYDDYRKVNETAERMGGVLNAYTSHDLVAFHITVRAEAAMEAIDLLTDFVGRPKLDADELDRERGVVIQEIQRYKDQPSAVAEELIDRAPSATIRSGRTVLGPEEHLRTFTPRRHRRLPRAPLVGRARRRVHRRQPRPPRRRTAASTSSSGASPTSPRPTPSSPRRRFAPRVLVERARHQPVAPADDLPPDVRRDRPRGPRRVHDLLDAAGRLDGLAPVRRDPRAARPLLLGLRRRPRLRRRAGPAARLRAWSRASASRPTRACARSSPSCAADGPTEEEVERARAYAAGRRVLAFENTNAVARYAANQAIVFGEDIDPDTGDRAARRGHPRRRRARPRATVDPDTLAVACVGPHTEADFA